MTREERLNGICSVVSVRLKIQSILYGEYGDDEYVETALDEDPEKSRDSSDVVKAD